jgi:hypothetical protein
MLTCTSRTASGRPRSRRRSTHASRNLSRVGCVSLESMDVALSFHIGLWARTQGREGRKLMNRDHRVRALLRRLDVVNESLDRAKEVEDFQAVGMRLRELLLTLALAYQSLFNRPTLLTHFRRQQISKRGVVPAQVAEWAGHSVAVLLRVYAKCIDGQDQIAKRRIEDALREPEDGTD